MIKLRTLLILTLITFIQCQKRDSFSNEKVFYQILPAVVDSVYKDSRLSIPLGPTSKKLNKEDSLNYEEKRKLSWSRYKLKKQKIKNSKDKIEIGLADSIRVIEYHHVKKFKERFNVKIDSSSLNTESKELNIAKVISQEKFIFKPAPFLIKQKKLEGNNPNSLYMGNVIMSNIVFDINHNYGVFTATYSCGKFCGHCTRFYIQRIDNEWKIMEMIDYCVA